MFTLVGAQMEVLNAVILFVAIDMMNKLWRNQIPAEIAFHDKGRPLDIAVVDRGARVAWGAVVDIAAQRYVKATLPIRMRLGGSPLSFVDVRGIAPAASYIPNVRLGLFGKVRTIGVVFGATRHQLGMQLRPRNMARLVLTLFAAWERCMTFDELSLCVSHSSNIPRSDRVVKLFGWLAWRKR